MLCLVVHLIAVGILVAEQIAGNLNCHNLHTETDTQSNEVILAAIPCCNDLTLETAWADTRADDVTVHPFEHMSHILLGNFLTVDEMGLYLAVVVCTALAKALVDTLVCILQVILAHKTYVYNFLCILATLHE